MRSISTYADVVDARKAGELSPGDEELLRNCEVGNPTVLNGGERPLAQSPATTVHAQVLRYVILGGCGTRRMHEWGVELYGAYIVGELDLRFITARGMTALVACNFDDFIHAINARFKVLNLSGSQITGIAAQSAKIQGNVLLRNGFRASGEISAAAAEIGGQLDCSGARLSNTNGRTLMAQGVKVGGDVFLNNGFFSSGEVAFSGAIIEGQFNFLNSQISNPGKNALMAEDMACRALFWKVGASIEGHISLIGAHTKSLVGDAKSWINADSYSLNGFTYERIVGFSGIKNRLEWVHKGAFDSEIDTFNPQPYEQLARVYQATGHNADQRRVLIAKERRLASSELERLKNTRQMRQEFARASRLHSPESWERLDAFLKERPVYLAEYCNRTARQFNLLHPHGSNEIRGIASWALSCKQFNFRDDLAWKNGKTQLQMLGLLLKDRAMDWLVGYGYKPFNVLRFLAFLLFIVIILAHLAWDAGDFAPNSDVILSTQAWQDLAEDPLVQNPAKEWSDTDGKGRDYETFSALAYGFDVVVPIVTIGQETAWAPSTTRGPWRRRLWWARWVLSVLGWIVTAVGAAAITGIIRRD